MLWWLHQSDQFTDLIEEAINQNRFRRVRCIYKHSSTYFQPLSQLYMAGFSKNKVRKEHLRFY